MTPGRNSFANICDGKAGIETMIPVVFSEGIRNDHLSLKRFVKLTQAPGRPATTRFVHGL